MLFVLRNEHKDVSAHGLARSAPSVLGMGAFDPDSLIETMFRGGWVI